MLILKQAIGAAAFDSRVYKAIADSPEAVFRSLLVVTLAGIAFGLGMRTVAIEGRDEGPTMLMLLGFATVITGWLLWATVVYLLGTLLLGGKARHRDLMRSMGMAYGPGLLLALVAVPTVEWTIIQIPQVIVLIPRLWMLVAGVIAVRETQGYGTFRAIGPTGIGWVLAHWLLPSIVFAPTSA